MKVPVPLLVLATMLAGCGGGNTTLPVAPMNAAALLSASPSSVTSPLSNSSPIPFTITNAQGALTAAVADPTIASATVSGTTVSVTPVAAGSTTVAVSDGRSSVTVPVSVALCTYPYPLFVLASPQPGSANVPSSTTAAVVGVNLLHVGTVPGVAPWYHARIITGAGTVLAAGPLSVLAQPPAGVSTPGADGYLSVPLPPLQTGTKYTVQVVDSAHPCEGTSVAGSFST